MRGVWSLAVVVAVTGWCLMLAVGILESVGAVGWTLGYNEACALAALGLLPVVTAGVVAAVLGRNATEGSGK